MNIPAKNGNGAVFQLSAVTLPDGSLSQAITLVDSTGAAIAAWPLSEGAASEAALQAILAKLNGSLAVTGPLTDAQLRATALPVSGTFWQPTQPVSLAAVPLATDAATNSKLEQVRALLATTLGVSVSNFPATQAVSAAALPLPTGAATAAAQTTGNSSLASILAALQGQLAVAVQSFPSDYPDASTLAKLEQVRALLAGTVAVSGPVTNAQLRASPLEVTGSISVEPAAGAATEAKQDALLDLFKAEDAPAVSGDKGLLLLAQRFVADTPTTDTDGDYAGLKVDEEGRLKVSSKPASYADVTGDITAVQASMGTPVAGGTVVADVSRASNVMAFCTGTFSGVNVSFEASLESSGETNWFSIQAVRTNANTIETATGALSAQPIYGWEASVNAVRRVRVRCTARTSGTQSWRFVLGTYATEPIPAAQASATQPVSGSVTATPATASPSNINSAASINASAIKGSAGSLFNVAAYNSGAGPAYVKFYNKAGAPAPASDVPVIVIPVAAGALVPVSFGTIGHRFATGIAIAITGGVADTDTTAVAAGQVKVISSYL